ncbi:hypothetical protein FRB96_005119 [Tulasnella sp. 330]|nr:hypothetical protein FRB96_005119 [Tulasnella sp. 330]
MVDYLAITKKNVPQIEQEQATVWVDGKCRLVPDLTHHLSDLALKRTPSSLKVLFKYLADPELLSLAGGTPHPDYFPYDSLSAKVLPHDAYGTVTPGMSSSSTQLKSNPQPLGWIWRLLGYGGGSAPRTEDIHVPKYDSTGREANQLSVSLQYGMATGMSLLQKFILEFARRVHKPYLPTTMTLLNTGNTDAWNRVVQTLINPGDTILVEEWSYPAALTTSRPYEASFAPVAMDGEGMRADALEYVLEHWNEEERGSRRPHVMYMVPIGQNPCGATMGAQRKKDIYEVCVKYDIIICEDDPYYFLQEGPYVPQAYRSREAPAAMDPDEWFETLSPSFLRFDYEGRVIRLDTFSKTIAPGARLGWFTCSPLFADRLLRVGEVSTQAPCGFGQSMVTELVVNHWGFDKYARWLQGLQGNYKERRDGLLDAIADEFDLSEETAEPSFFGGIKMFVAKEKTPAWTPYVYAEEKKRTLFSFIPPTSGMFVWIRVPLVDHPDYDRKLRDAPEQTEHLEAKLFFLLVEHKLLIGPGWIFSTRLEDVPVIPQSDRSVLALLNGNAIDAPNGDPADHDPAQYAHFRISFSSANTDQFKTAMHVLGRVLRLFFQGAK